MKVLIDGVVFGAASSAGAGAWERLLEVLAPTPDLRIHLLDRGGAPEITGIVRVAFPSYRAAHTPADSQLLQRMATHYGADVFMSTAWTTPTRTPSIAVVFAGALPPLATLSERESAECALAVRHASQVVCVGPRTRAALCDHLDLTDEQLADALDVDQGEAALGPAVVAAMRTAVADAPAAATFYERWAALRDIQARVDG